MPVFKIFGNIPEDMNALKNLAKIGEVIVEMHLSTLIGMSLALLDERSFIISLISSGEHSSRNMLDSTEFFYIVSIIWNW